MMAVAQDSAFPLGESLRVQLTVGAADRLPRTMETAASAVVRPHFGRDETAGPQLIHFEVFLVVQTASSIIMRDA